LSQSNQIAIVAALEWEVSPLIQGWPAVRKQSGDRWFTFFEKDNVVAVCAGIGAEAARRAAEAVVEAYRPAVLVSAGFAGALEATMSVGQVMIPGVVIDSRDGSRAACDGPDGVLVSFSEIADASQKKNLRQAYAAQAVDMEAAAIARSAEAHGIRFVACKAISDTSGSSLPSVSRFIDSEGRWSTFGFAAFLALRPWLWPSIWRLAADSKRAAHSLCKALTEICAAAAHEDLHVVNR
jgi:adenosylhomocysteine nucleosidase